MTPLLPADGCGNCLTPGRAITVHPHHMEIDDGGHCLRAWYRCPACRWSWWTGWAIPCPGGCPECPAGAA